MPVYEYECQKCGHVTSFRESMSYEGEHPCEECASTKTVKVLSTFAPHGGSSSAPACPSGACPTGPSSPCAGGSCPFG